MAKLKLIKIKKESQPIANGFKFQVLGFRKEIGGTTWEIKEVRFLKELPLVKKEKHGPRKGEIIEDEKYKRHENWKKMMKDFEEAEIGEIFELNFSYKQLKVDSEAIFPLYHLSTQTNFIVINDIESDEWARTLSPIKLEKIPEEISEPIECFLERKAARIESKIREEKRNQEEKAWETWKNEQEEEKKRVEEEKKGENQSE